MYPQYDRFIIVSDRGEVGGNGWDGRETFSCQIPGLNTEEV